MFQFLNYFYLFCQNQANYPLRFGLVFPAEILTLDLTKSTVNVVVNGKIILNISTNPNSATRGNNPPTSSGSHGTRVPHSGSHHRTTSIVSINESPATQAAPTLQPQPPTSSSSSNAGVSSSQTSPTPATSNTSNMSSFEDHLGALPQGYVSAALFA